MRKVFIVLLIFVLSFSLFVSCEEYELADVASYTEGDLAFIGSMLIMGGIEPVLALIEDEGEDADWDWDSIDIEGITIEILEDFVDGKGKLGLEFDNFSLSDYLLEKGGMGWEMLLTLGIPTILEGSIDLSVTEESEGSFFVSGIDADVVIRLVHTVGGAAYYHLQLTSPDFYGAPPSTFIINGREVDLSIFDWDSSDD